MSGVQLSTVGVVRCTRDEAPVTGVQPSTVVVGPLHRDESSGIGRLD